MEQKSHDKEATPGADDLRVVDDVRDEIARIRSFWKDRSLLKLAGGVLIASIPLMLWAGGVVWLQADALPYVQRASDMDPAMMGPAEVVGTPWILFALFAKALIGLLPLAYLAVVLGAQLYAPAASTGEEPTPSLFDRRRLLRVGGAMVPVGVLMIPVVYWMAGTTLAHAALGSSPAYGTLIKLVVAMSAGFLLSHGVYLVANGRKQVWKNYRFGLRRLMDHGDRIWQPMIIQFGLALGVVAVCSALAYGLSMSRTTAVWSPFVASLAVTLTGYAGLVVFTPLFTAIDAESGDDEPDA